jgi:hypothetical protein
MDCVDDILPPIWAARCIEGRWFGFDHIDAVGRRLWSRALDGAKENRRRPAAVSSNVIELRRPSQR